MLNYLEIWGCLLISYGGLEIFVDYMLRNYGYLLVIIVYMGNYIWWIFILYMNNLSVFI